MTKEKTYQIKLLRSCRYPVKKIRGGILVNKNTWKDIPKDYWGMLREREINKRAQGSNARSEPSYDFRAK